MCHINLLTHEELRLLQSLGLEHRQVFSDQIENLPRTREHVVGLLHRAVDLKDGRTTANQIREEVTRQRLTPDAEWNSEYEKRQRKQAYVTRMSPTFVGGVPIR